MQRRKFLGVLAGAGAVPLTGCSTDDSERTDGYSSGAPSFETESIDTPTATPEPVVDASITEAKLATRELGRRTQVAAKGGIENTGDVWLTSVSVTAKFYDADEQLLNTSAANLRGLAPGEVWEFWAPYTDDSSEVDSFEVVIGQALQFGRTVNPESVAVKSSTLEIPSDTFAYPIVSGEVQNTSGGEVPFVIAHPKVYDQNGIVLGSGTTSISSFAPDEEWRIDAGVYLQNEFWKDRIDNHNIVLAV